MIVIWIVENEREEMCMIHTSKRLKKIFFCEELTDVTYNPFVPCVPSIGVQGIRYDFVPWLFGNRNFNYERVKLS